jgi:DNA (cytosine-5)-methyltransferase 1
MSKPTVISLFTGAGGLDFGFEAAGFETNVAVEMNHDACQTLRANRAWPVIERDIAQVPTKELLKTASVRVGDVDVLIGGPPCQPFSKSGYWVSGDAKRLEDPRSSTLGAYLRVLEEAKPRAFLLENVEGLAFRGKDEGLRLLMEAFDKINRRAGTKYKPIVRMLNAADYGVPQLRKRVIIVGARDGTELTFPEPTHGESKDLFRNLRPFATAWDAIGDLEPDLDEELHPTGRWADLLPSIPEGSNYLFHTSRGGGEPLFGWRRHYWTFLLKLAKDLPSWTIQAQPGPAAGPFHWDNRRLSRRELCRLQTFPDDVKVVGSRIAAQRQIGNAVPSLLAEVIARCIRTQLLGRRLPSVAPRLLRPTATTTPARRIPERVKTKFMRLRGEHIAHPGPGLGNGAIQRSLF